MNFTDTEIQYLTHDAQKSGRKVIDEFDRNFHNNIVSFREAYGYVPESNLFADLLRKCAESVIEAHVESYVKLAEELERYPDGEDLKTLADFTRSCITSLLPRYREFAERAFGEDTPKVVVDATEKALEFDLPTIFSDAWAPMMTLHMKGRVAEERSKTHRDVAQPNSQSNPPQTSSGHQTYNTFHGPVGAVQQGNKSTANVEMSKIPEATEHPSRWRTQYVTVPMAIGLLATTGAIVSSLITSSSSTENGNTMTPIPSRTPTSAAQIPSSSPSNSPTPSPRSSPSGTGEIKTISQNKTAFFFQDGLSISVNDVRPNTVSLTIGGDGIKATTLTRGVGPLGTFRGKQTYDITLTEIGFTVSNAIFAVTRRTAK
jgi:hypothetical protein